MWRVNLNQSLIPTAGPNAVSIAAKQRSTPMQQTRTGAVFLRLWSNRWCCFVSLSIL